MPPVIDPTVGSALVSAGASVLGGIFGSSSQKSANKTNLQIARETNAANKEIAEMNNQFNLDMWNRQNEYNKASAQADRLREAGLNPYLTMTGDNAGTAQGLTADTSGTQQMPHAVQGYDWSQVGNQVAQTAANTGLYSAQLELQAQDVETRRMAQVAAQGVQAEEAHRMRLLTPHILEAQKLANEDKNYWNARAPWIYNQQQYNLQKQNELLDQNIAIAKLDKRVHNLQSKIADSKLPYVQRMAQIAYLNALQDYKNSVLAGTLTIAAAKQAMSNAGYLEQLGLSEKQKTELLAKQNAYFDNVKGYRAASERYNSSIMGSKASMAKYSDDQKEVKFWLDATTQSLDAIGGVISSVKPGVTVRNGQRTTSQTTYDDAGMKTTTTDTSYY